MSSETARDVAARVLHAEAAAIRGVAERLGPELEAAVEALAACQGRVVVTGLGKSGLIGRKIAATLSSTGTPAFFLHPTEALHGDLGGVVPGDVALFLSHGGETEELVRLVPLVKDLDCTVITLCGRGNSTLARAAEVVLDVSVDAEACPLGLAPTASSTATLAMGDALAMAVMTRRGFSADDFGKVHPGGSLGHRFRKVRDLMHAGPDMPTVSPDTPIREVIPEISAKRLGMAVVLEGGRLAGVITDSDLRRLFQEVASPLDLPARDVMTRSPRTVDPEALAATARRLLRAPPHSVPSLVVVARDGQVVGVVHHHDLAGVRR